MLLGLRGGTDSFSSSDRSPAGGGSKAVACISVGDRVVRGPGWNWAQDQDGGPGGYGTVVDVRKLGAGMRDHHESQSMNSCRTVHPHFLRPTTSKCCGLSSEAVNGLIGVSA